jgi:hypothetical protein
MILDQVLPGDHPCSTPGELHVTGVKVRILFNSIGLLHYVHTYNSRPEPIWFLPRVIDARLLVIIYLQFARFVLLSACPPFRHA